MLEHLGRSANQCEVMNSILDLPEGLEKAYVLVLSRILDSYDLKFIKKLLEISSIACRPLTTEERLYTHALSLNQMLAVKPDSKDEWSKECLELVLACRFWCFE